MTREQDALVDELFGQAPAPGSLIAWDNPTLLEAELIHLHLVACAPLVALELVAPARLPHLERLKALRLIEPVEVRRCGIGGRPYGVSAAGARIVRAAFGIGIAPPEHVNLEGLDEHEADALHFLRTLSWQRLDLIDKRHRPTIHRLVERGLAERRTSPAPRATTNGEPERVRLRVIQEAW